MRNFNLKLFLIIAFVAIITSAQRRKKPNFVGIRKEIDKQNEARNVILKNSYENFGGSYKEGNRNFKGRNGLYEVNHTPPKSAYKNTPYENINENDMPAALMEYKDHRKYQTTGNGNDESAYTYVLNRKNNLIKTFSF